MFDFGLPIRAPVIEMLKHEKLQNATLICFQNYKHLYLIHTLSDKVFKGTVVNRALTSF